MSDVATTAAPARPAMFLALGCVGFIASAPAWAADADATKDEGAPDILVDGVREKPKLISPKAVADLIDTPRSIVVIDKETIRETGSASLVEALRTVPGITFGAAEGGNPIGDRPFIRGFDSQGSTYLDGVRDIGAQNREVFAVEQIQVVRGSDSTLGGRGSAGGSLNIVSKLPEARTFATADLSFGTADYKRTVADLNYQLSDTVAVRLNGLWHDQDVAGRDAIYSKRWGVAPSITIGLGTPTRLTASYYHLESDELPDSGIPFLYTIGNTPKLGTHYSEPAVGAITTIAGTTGTVDRDTYYGLKDRDFRDATTDQATLRVEHDFGGVTLRNFSRFSHSAQSYIFTMPDDSQGNVYGTSAASPATAGGQVWRRANTRFGSTDSIINQTDLYGTLSTGTIKHSFAVGTEVSWEKAVRGAYVLSDGRNGSPRCSALGVARYTCTSAFTPNPNDPFVNYSTDTATGVPTAITKGLPITRTQNDARTIAVYGFDSITLTDALILNLGLRYDDFHIESQPGLTATSTGPRYRLTRDDQLLNGQVGLVFKPTAHSSLYASFATAATPPNSLLGEGAEQNGIAAAAGTAADQIAAATLLLDALKVEKTKSYEVGAKVDLFGDRLSLTAAAFRTETKNARATSDAGTVTFIGERRIEGVELGANGTILPGWTVTGGYTYLDAQIVDGGFSTLTAAAVGAQAAKTVSVVSVNTGRRFPQTAKHSATLWTNWQATPAFSLGGGGFYTGRVIGGYSDNRSAVQDAAGVVTVVPASRTLIRSVPGYWRFDARAAYRFNNAVELAVNVQNLTDKTYFNQVYTAHYAGIAPGRSAFATLSLKY
ncbi:TonB-dependent receptor [Sphingomonas prati]|uniref:Catecholate siderophore receptor n=2 Tax=Sphingomonas prati TaxID=1843237 RepID=A0A7W9BU37_9SPHN|nr:catecholate siderophore receptor [Sphingomonas prati]GGE88233.1 iron transport receptor protein [Sphingomonas prati]